MKDFKIFGKHPIKGEMILLNEETGNFEYTNNIEEKLVLTFIAENNRGWRFANYTMGSGINYFFFSRGEYEKIDVTWN